jgi:hypothetical protein
MLANRLAQIGILGIVAGGVVLFLGWFPAASDLDDTTGIGIAQLTMALAGIFLIVLDSYLVAYALIHMGRPRTLLKDVGVRMGLSGLVFLAASALADVMGFGSHSDLSGGSFGWLQIVGVMGFFLLSAVGVFVYGMARS